MELLVDNFAGGGGASTGIERAVGRCVDIAVNHDASAIEMHAANHPGTRHYREDVWKVNPRRVCGRRRVGLAWFSPDCKHFSRAKGGKPVSPRVRGLAWVAVRWAKEVSPRVIILENVREFREWGPLIPKVVDGAVVLDLHGNPQLVPDPARKGHSFKRFVGSIRNLGYQVEWRDMDAADYGAPTHRRRLFLIARNDGEAIVWPEKTHGPGRALPYRTAAECIDWSKPGTSIFEPRSNGKFLVNNTMRRLAHGFVRFVANNPKPYIVTCNHSGRGFRGQSVDEPFSTVTASRDAHGVVTPYVIQNAHEPGPAILGSNHHTYVASWVIKHFGGQIGASIQRPLPTTTTRGTQNQVAAVRLIKLTDQQAEWYATHYPNALKIYAFIVKYYGASQHGQSLNEPLHTTTGKARFALVEVLIDGESWIVVDILMRMFMPRELARAQGFDEDYILTGSVSQQTARIGNSVCPVMADVLVRANYFDASVQLQATA